jgi:Fe-S-cluster-containing dehydrogenase component
MEIGKSKRTIKRRHFLQSALVAIAAFSSPALLGARESLKRLQSWILGEDYNPFEHHWGMAIDVNRCIGCGRCVQACKVENDVPDEPYFFRTWVERYHIFEDGTVEVDSPNGAIEGFTKKAEFSQNVIRSFFVPKLCNQCDNPPFVQVCPVGATFKTPDGVILIDPEHCIGCGYCIQACPYGARFINPETNTVDKCTFCYHRLVKGMAPACVEACPTQARIFGELDKKSSPLMRFKRMNKVGVLKPALNTEPKVIYANLDMEVN